MTKSGSKVEIKGRGRKSQIEGRMSRSKVGNSVVIEDNMIERNEKREKRKEKRERETRTEKRETRKEKIAREASASIRTRIRGNENRTLSRSKPVF